jgi:hypothetical protein
VKAAELRALREGGAAAPATRKKPGKGKPEEEKPSPFAPPLVVNVPPSAWSDVWVEHPKEIVKLGLRRITADALLAAHVEAAKKADEYLPDEEHESALWQITQQTIRLHIVLCYALTDPTDYRSPPMLWGHQDGTMWVLPEPSGEGIISARFTREGIAMLYDALEIVAVKDNPTYPVLGDAETERLGEELVDGTFFASITPGVGPDDDDSREERRALVETQIRRLLGYVDHLRRTGFTAPIVY